jgi:hypothetical protein
MLERREMDLEFVTSAPKSQSFVDHYSLQYLMNYERDSFSDSKEEKSPINKSRRSIVCNTSSHICEQVLGHCCWTTIGFEIALQTNQRPPALNQH